ncbi:NADP-dependent 3-hydroxy acid dehydrogenase YdfG [Motilibacter peucedani]|uniref:NADP-dependent 3-hydroxy acid dehydrogenase YdfG n=1 Tax=Motilibacter peucedani TaxID=598650 RepID=A0A420XQI1_9ACTN|nr:SDR family NAD(P)-dependent oxidoreductase [Motilibacter peucedani]RKS75530.1 NADP-dependent 3-hydroxy acid dehydrogenase YdfG [Motilibacter peucedani]
MSGGPADGLVLVAGAGPGVGLATARAFASHGHPVGLVARDEQRLAGNAEELRAGGAVADYALADVRDDAAFAAAVASLTARHGPVVVLAFTPLPDVALIQPVVQTTPDHIAGALALGVTAAVRAAQAVLPGMLERGAGTLLFTTGSAAVAPSPDRAASAVANAAESVYVRLLHEAVAAYGITVAQLVIVGAVGPGRKHEPAAVAERLWQLHAESGEVLSVLQ